MVSKESKEPFFFKLQLSKEEVSYLETILKLASWTKTPEQYLEHLAKTHISDLQAQIRKLLDDWDFQHTMSRLR